MSGSHEQREGRASGFRVLTASNVVPIDIDSKDLRQQSSAEYDERWVGLPLQEEHKESVERALPPMCCSYLAVAVTAIMQAGRPWHLMVHCSTLGASAGFHVIGAWQWRHFPVLIEERVGTPKINQGSSSITKSVCHHLLDVKKHGLSYLDIPSQESNGEKGHPCFVPDCRRKATVFLPVSILAVGFLKDTFYQVEELPFYS